MKDHFSILHPADLCGLKDAAIELNHQCYLTVIGLFNGFGHLDIHVFGKIKFRILVFEPYTHIHRVFFLKSISCTLVMYAGVYSILLDN